MKILLIDIGSNRKELNEPIGIELIAGSVINSIKDVHIDFIWELIEPITIDISKCNYDIIGISAKLGTYPNLEFLLSKLINERKSKKVIIGGPLSTFAYPELLSKYKDIICVRGEGETAFTEICKRLEVSNNLTGLDFNSIPNLAFINNDGILYKSKRAVENLDEFPKPFRHYLNEIINKKGIIRIEGSRGCSWSKCDFCSVCTHYGTDKWRPFPITYIIEELIDLSKAGCLSPYFTDEDFFGGDYDRSKKLANEIIIAKNENRINPKMNFFFSSRINDILHTEGYELLKLWKLAGLRELFVGLESGVQKQLQRYGKAATPNRNAKAINLLKELNIQLDTGYILFDPEMSYDELIENVEYIEKENLSHHDSRSLKKIRAQPFTETTKGYFKKKLIIGDLNLNLLYYPLKYMDKKVYNTLELFDLWEKKLSSKVYSIQTLSRGEISSEKYRIYLKEQLSNIREIDFVILKKIIEYTSQKISLNELILQQQKSEIEKSKIINSIQTEINWAQHAI